MAEVGDRLDGFGDDIVARLAAQSGDEADAAGVVLEARVIQPVGPRKKYGILVCHLPPGRRRK
jgi:hypothetical protein